MITLPRPIGQRQAGTFRVLANLAGHGDPHVPKAVKPKISTGAPKAKSNVKIKSVPISAPTHNTATAQLPINPAGSNFGLTVRVEINLPADGTKETYDNIFKSIRENLLNG